VSSIKKFRRATDKAYTDGYNQGVVDMSEAIMSDFYEALKDEPGIGKATFEKIQNTLDKVGSEL